MERKGDLELIPKHLSWGGSCTSAPVKSCLSGWQFNCHPNKIMFWDKLLISLRKVTFIIL